MSSEPNFNNFDTPNFFKQNTNHPRQPESDYQIKRQTSETNEQKKQKGKTKLKKRNTKVSDFDKNLPEENLDPFTGEVL